MHEVGVQDAVRGQSFYHDLSSLARAAKMPGPGEEHLGGWQQRCAGLMKRLCVFDSSQSLPSENREKLRLKM